MNRAPVRETFRQPETVEQLAVGLGWLSIGVGLAELAAPRRIARLVGLRDDDRSAALLKAFGVREIGQGVGILSQPERPAWLWSRVGGDVIDLAVLGAAMDTDHPHRGRRAAATAAVLGVTAMDVLCARGLSRPEVRAHIEQRQRLSGRKSITVNRPVSEVYQFWRTPENLPRFMRHIESVETTADGRSHWIARGPGGVTIEWDAEIVEDRENALLAWRSLPGSPIENRGTVRFEPAPRGRGTEVHMEMEYRPVGGRLGRGLAWLFGQTPQQRMTEDLRRFKQVIETGDIVVSEGPGLWRPAQPFEDPHEAQAYEGGRP